MRRRSKRRTLRHDDTDPSSLVSNLFDVAMVFAVALMVALVTKFSMTEMLTQEDFTIIKNPGKDHLQERLHHRAVHTDRQRGCLQSAPRQARRHRLRAGEWRGHLHPRGVKRARQLTNR